MPRGEGVDDGGVAYLGPPPLDVAERGAGVRPRTPVRLSPTRSFISRRTLPPTKRLYQPSSTPARPSEGGCRCPGILGTVPGPRYRRDECLRQPLISKEIEAAVGAVGAGTTATVRWVADKPPV